MRRLWLCAMLLLMLVYIPGRVSAEEIRMNVMEPGIRSASVDLNQDHIWYIRCYFSENVRNGGQYTVILTLSPGLSIIPGSLEVRFLDSGRNEYPLVIEKDYILTAGAVMEGNGIAERYSILLTEEGSRPLPHGGELRITYRTRINESAEIGTQLLGTAQLSSVDSEGNRTVILSDKATVSTGGVSIHLTDEKGMPLSGGEFMLARKVSVNEQGTELLDTGEQTVMVKYVPFCPSNDLCTDMTYTARTDWEGNALCYGLRYGEYYLVQTNPGDGADLATKPVKVLINEASHITAKDGWKNSAGEKVDYTIYVKNSVLTLPNTGDRGIYSCRAAGSLVILCACLLLWYNSKGRILFQ